MRARTGLDDRCRETVRLNLARRLITAMALAALACASAVADTLPLPASLIGLGSEAGRQLFFESTAREAYWPLSMQFVTQKSQSFCGVASMVMVLNALGVAAPVSPETEPFSRFSQDNLLNEKTEAILPLAVLLKKGMTLDQFGRMLQSFGPVVSVTHAADSDVDRFRSTAAAALGMPRHHVVVNYLRRALGQERGGHISPLAAYDAHSDRFLVLDVSRYKYPPAWVSTADLFAAMNTVDAESDRTRGYVLIE